MRPQGNVQKTKRSNTILKIWGGLAVIWLCMVFSAKAYTDQVVATIGPSAITLRDVRLHAFLTSLLHKEKPSPNQFFLHTRTAIKKYRTFLVQRAVILNYLQVSGISLSPKESRVQEVKKQVTARFASEKAMKGFLSTLGVDIEEVNRWILEKLQMEQFVDEQIGMRVQLSESEVRSHYDKKRESRYLGESWEKVRPVVRAELFRDRLKTELKKWLDTEITRVGVVFLPLRNGV